MIACWIAFFLALAAMLYNFFVIAKKAKTFLCADISSEVQPPTLMKNFGVHLIFGFLTAAAGIAGIVSTILFCLGKI
jgi:hypothetical protein